MNGVTKKVQEKGRGVSGTAKSSPQLGFLSEYVVADNES